LKSLKRALRPSLESVVKSHEMSWVCYFFATWLLLAPRGKNPIF